ncbi:MAG TPA: hypothetical protein VK578_06635 [Edaphobacter sp.]|nr:hypothetical protein [Edaphobacter sp.]
MKMWISVSMMLAASAASYGQAVPTAEASTGAGPHLSWIDGTIHYSLSASELVQDGLYGSGNVTGATNLGGNAGYASTSKDKPFSLIYAGGIMFGWGGGQGTTTYQNIFASQSLMRGKWIFNVTNSFSYLPQSPTTGYSGISGVGDLGTTPISGPSSGPAGGVLTYSGNRISNGLSGSVERRLTGSTSVNGSGSWSVLHFLDQNAGLNTTQITGDVGLNHRIDVRNSAGVSADYSTYTTDSNSSLGQLSSPSFQTKGVNFTYTRLWTRALSMDASVGPQWINSSGGTVLPARVNVAASVNVYYNRKQTSMGAHYFRGVNAGSGVLTGALSDSINGSIGHPLGRAWMGSASVSYTRTSQLLSFQPLPGVIVSENQSYKTFFTGAQLTRSLGRAWSCFLSYGAQNQSINNGLVGQNAFNGFSQTFGAGITFAPRSTRLGEF